MNKQNNKGVSLNTFSNLAEINQRVKDLINSKLSNEEKIKALVSFEKVKKTIVIFISIMSAILILLFIISCMNGMTNFWIYVICGYTLIYIISIIICVTLAKNRAHDWNKYSKIVEFGWDGLTEEERKTLSLNSRDNDAIKKYKNKDIFVSITLIIAYIIEFSILINRGVKIYSPISIIITFVITAIWYVLHDTYMVEIHRLKSGFYKKDFGFYCSNCKTEVKIRFDEIEKYDSLPKNKDNIRIMKCPKCGNDVPFYNFDNCLSDYRNYKK